MITISHAQARRLIQAAADGRTMTTEQWAQMQAHLESCADCNAYAQQLAVLEGDLRSELRARWAAPPVKPGMGRAVAARMSGSALSPRVWSALGAALMLLLLAALIFGAGRLIPQPARSLEPSATPGPTPIPSPTPLGFERSFHSVVLYESRQDGNDEIYLLNPAGSPAEAQPINLTNDLSEDSAPVWSPDGEWIAFLSNRSGRAEVYAMHVSGSRLRQITNSPEIEWAGPLDWSPDGQYLALHGTRTLKTNYSDTPQQESSVYLLPIAPNAPVRTPLMLYASDASGPIRFAPNQPLLAFSGNYDNDVRYAYLYNLRTGESYTFSPSRANLPGPGGTFSETSFDWAPDSSRLVMIDEGPLSGDITAPPADSTRPLYTQSEVAMSADLSRGIYPSPGYGGVALLSLARGDTGKYQAAGWTRSLDQLAYLSLDGGDPACLTLHLRSASQKADLIIDQAVPGLCVESGVERANWSANGGWLVLKAHRPGESTSALWALSPSGGTIQDQSPAQNSLQRIQPNFAEAPLLVQLTQGVEVGTPRLRPNVFTALDLDPQPLVALSAGSVSVGSAGGASSGSASSAGSNLPPADAARGSDWLLIQRRMGADQYALLEWSPATGQERELIRHDEPLTCASYSPDRQQIAFMRFENNGQAASYAGRNEIWLMDADGQNARPLTQERPSEADTANTLGAMPITTDERFYICPLFWSPDGRSLAADYENWPNRYHAILPLDGSPAKYVRTADTLVGWTPDGARLLQTRNGISGVGSEGALIAIDPARVGDLDMGQGVSKLLASDGWASISGLSFAPDGRQIALLVQYTRSGDPWQVAKSELRLLAYDPAQPDASLKDAQQTLFTLADALGNSHTANLRWLPDGTLVFSRSHGVTLVVPSQGEILRYDPAAKTLRPLVMLYDHLLDLAWSPDGQWAMYRTQSGAGLIDIPRAWDSQAGPRPVDLPVSELEDWK